MFFVHFKFLFVYFFIMSFKSTLYNLDTVPLLNIDFEYFLQVTAYVFIYLEFSKEQKF